METRKLRKLNEQQTNLVNKFVEETHMNHRDVINERTTEEKKSHIRKGKIGEVATLNLLLENGISSNVNFENKPDDGSDLSCLNHSINVRILIGENVDFGRDMRLYKKNYDNGDVYVSWKVYENGDHEFLGWIESKYMKNRNYITIDQLMQSEEFLISFLKS
jgi:hypothetical protein